MKTVLVIDTTRPIGVRELNEFLSGIAQRVPGCFVSQGPSTPGRLTVMVLSPHAVPLEAAEEVLDTLPDLCDAVTGLALRESSRLVPVG